jgi:tetratricopeptide (TPR) repeat protein
MTTDPQGLSGVRDWKLWAALAAITFLLYWPTTGHGFIYLDDDYYVWNNPNVNRGLTASGIWWALTSYDYFYWQPVTWISHMLDCELFGLAPGGHHFTNAVLHALNAVLALLALWQLTGNRWLSALTAALFAWHPLRIESVAWIAERKDLLSALFFLLALWAYGHYGVSGRKRSYWMAAGAMLLGIASKPTVVTLPFVLLLLDYWPLKRKESWPSLLLEKLPFFALSIAASVLTFLGQQEMGAVGTIEEFPLPVRIANALASYAHYLANTVWPYPLAAFYPYRNPVPVPWVVAGAALLLGGTAIVLWQARRRAWLTVGWLWFLGVLVPALGLVQAGLQAYADRFSYLPSIGLWMALVWLGSELRLKPAAGVAAAGLYAILTFLQVGNWKDSETLFTHTLAVTGANPVIQANLGFVLLEKGNNDEAARLLRKTVEEQPRYFRAWSNLGAVLERTGKKEEALEAFAKAAELEPTSGTAKLNLGLLHLQVGKAAEAEALVSKALTMDLGSLERARAEFSLGVMEGQKGRAAEAEKHFRASLVEAPRDAAVHRFLVQSLLDQNRRDEALRHLAYAVQVTGGNPDLRQIQQTLLLQRER